MTSKTTLEQFQDELRQIVEIVNTQLIASGHNELAIQAGDFELEPSANPKPASDLNLRYVLADDLDVKIAPIFLLDSQRRLESFANDLARALVNLDKGRKFLIRYYRSVRAAANAAVKSARESGYRIKRVEVALKRTYAFHLTHSKWREAVSHVIAMINLEVLKADGDPDEHWLVIENSEDVAGEVESVLPN